MPITRACSEVTSRHPSARRSSLRAHFPSVVALTYLLAGATAHAKERAPLPEKAAYQSYVFAGKVDPKFRYEVRVLDKKGELLSSFPVYSGEGEVLSGDTLRVDGATALQTAVWMSDELLLVSEPREFEPRAPLEVRLPEQLGSLALLPVSVSVTAEQVSEDLRRFDFNVLDQEGRQLPIDPELVQWSKPFGPEVNPVIPKPPIGCRNSPSCIFLPLKPKEIFIPELTLTVCLGPLCAVTEEPEEPEEAPNGWKSIAAGSGFTCGLSQRGRVLCWGDRISGLLGQPTSHCVLPPSAPPSATCSMVPKEIVQPPGSLTTFQSLDVGESHACAVDTSGALWCWGQLGFAEGSLCPGGAASCTRAPFRLNPNDPSVPNTPARLKGVSAGTRHTCALTTGGSALCFGGNARGEAGESAPGVTFNPVGAAGAYESVSAGRRHSCALTKSGGVDCWGWTIMLTRLSESIPPPPFLFMGRPQGVLGEHPQISQADRVSVGQDRTCIHDPNGTLSCLDELRTDQFRWDIEHIDPATSELETALMDRETKCQVESGNLFCDLPQFSTRHTLLPFSNAVTDCSVEMDHGCAVEADGTAWCWGKNARGQLGDGTTVDADPTKPVAVLLP